MAYMTIQIPRLSQQLDFMGFDMKEWSLIVRLGYEVDERKNK